MKFFIILLLLGSRVMLIGSRPTRLEEEDDSETAEVEYEGNDDDMAADDYLREEQEPVMDEASQRSGRPENVQQESQEQGDARDFEVASDQKSDQDKYRYDSFSDINSGSQKEKEHHRIADINTESEKDYLSEKARLRKSQQLDETGNVAPDFFSRSRSHLNQPQNDLTINGKSRDTDSEYGEMLFKMKTAQTNRQQNNIAEEDQQPTILQQYHNNMHSKNIDQDSRNALNYERDRRHAENINQKQNSDSTRTSNEKEEINESSENAIIRNIKKLSEHDLEELLNSLPDDKKELLKKIMDKREITKKAGAVDESSYLEGGLPDTSKLEGGYSVDSNTEPSMTTDTTETNKQPENSDDFSSKPPERENGSRITGSESEITSYTDMKNEKLTVQKESENSITDSKNDVNVRSDDEEFSKNENKRETNNKDSAYENISLEDSKISDYQFESKDPNDFLVNQEDLCSENEDWIDTKLNEPEQNNARSETYKREISQKEPLLQDCVKSLEESFPTANSYEYNNLESDMAPLKRVKRTEKDHHSIKKRDSALLPNGNVHFSPGVEDEDCENKEKNEFEDYGTFGRASNFVSNDNQLVKSSKESISDRGNKQRRSQFEKMDSGLHPAIFSESESQEDDKKESLGSDTDSVLSGIEGVDENLMYNSGSRGKRTLESLDVNADKINLNRIGRTAGPMNDAVSSNAINVSQYQVDEAFGPLSRDCEEDVSRFKRVRQVKQK